ncbi:uncharacterized protein LOC130217046 [Danio aesculapii]|uniref:uncharacterized protein LOC130217046 n=1 Tax=Danio aesculapii TaxID=1142201 RepID=UPI0024C01FED|nr:uncharacterized protein LOC130217046 [Danio aesculapii]
MADRSPLFLLLIFWTLSTGVFEAEETHVFSRSGETVHLPCINTDQYCSKSGTTWLYNSYRQTTTPTQTVELINLGVNKKDTGKHDRLNLGSDCSLIISRVTTEDTGRYFCQQWREDQKDRPYAQVSMYLHVVAVSPSSSSSSSSSSDIRPAPDLTTKAEPKPQAETTEPGAVFFSHHSEAKTAALTPTNTNTTIKPAEASITAVLSVLLSAAALAVFIAAVLCLIQRRRRAAAHQRATGESAVKDENQVHYQTIHMSINPAARAHEQTEDPVTYSEVTCAGKKPEKSASDHSNDSVTYAAVSRRA